MAENLLGLTLWQPWASLIAAGVKPYEFRRWPAPRWTHGRRIAIHAGARKAKREELADLVLRLRDDGGHGTGLRPVDRALELLERWHTAPGMLPLSTIVCTATLGVPRKASDIFRGGASDSDRTDHEVWAWPVTEIRVPAPVVPCRGAQGFWAVPALEAEAVRQAEAEAAADA